MDINNEQKELLLSADVDHEGHAICTLALYPGIFRHNDTHGWLHYTGKYWQKEGAKQRLERCVTNTLQKRRVLFAEKDMMKKARLCSTWRNTVTSTAAQIAKTSSVFTPISLFDSDDALLNAMNGVVNLRTGERYPHKSTQLFTYCLPVAYKKDAPEPTEFMAFLKSTGISDEVINYLQLAVGYSLTGYTTEEVMFYLHGVTRSGKGTFTEVLNHLLGALSTGVSMETFTAKRYGDTSRFDLAQLKGKRVITASESTVQGQLNPATIKSITGGDEIYCSLKRKDHFSYRPQFKIWLTSNFPANVDVDDDAAWGRLRIIQFKNSYLGKEDKTLKQRLKSEESLEQILTWAVNGARDWFILQTTGLPVPQEVADTVKDHRLLLDGIGQFLEEMCARDKEYHEVGKVLYNGYKAWAEDEGHNVAKRKTFTQSLAKRGIITDRIRVFGKLQRCYIGVKFAENDEEIPI